MWQALWGLLLYASFTSVQSSGDMIGPGLFTVINVQKCDDHDEYENVIVCSRSKMNRTHDCFNADFEFTTDIDESYGVEMDLYMEVDGGFKFHQKFTDDSLCKLLHKYAEDNMKKALTMAGMDPPDCPMKKGKYKVREFIFDYTEMPEDNMYGTFKVYMYVTKMLRRLSCVALIIKFEKIVDDDYDDD